MKSSNKESNYKNQIDSLSRLSNRLESSLSRLSAKYREHKEHIRITADQVFSALPKGSSFIEFYKFSYQDHSKESHSDHYMAVCISDGNKPEVKMLGNADEIDTTGNADTSESSGK